MRVKQIIAHLPVVSSACSKVTLFWNRITATRLTTVYFIFSIAHCFVQAFLQGDAFTINAKAAAYLSRIVLTGNETGDGFFIWQDDGLRFCDYVPNTVDASNCMLVWQKGSNLDSDDPVSRAGAPDSYASYSYSTSLSVDATSSPIVMSTLSAAAGATASPIVTSAPLSAAQPSSTTVVVVEVADDDGDDNGEEEEEELTISPPSRRHFSAQVFDITLNGSVPVVLNGYGFHNQTVDLSSKCVAALNWPVQQLDNTKREDIAFISFQFWVLGMSIVAILNESIPHIIASLLTHLSATAWGAFQLAQTKAFHRTFSIIVTNGVCGINLLPTYWSARANVEIPSLVLNCVALIASVFLSWRLIKTFGWQTFKRVGASRTINRVYKLVLTLSVTIQLCLFFVVVSVALWLDQICNGAIGRFATAHKVFEALLIIVLVMLPVWLSTGWYAVRRELRVPMIVFLALCLGYIVGWGAMFDSTTFRWTISQWAFFTAIIVVGVVLVIICFIVGVFCRLNFGRGLPHYLNAEEPLPGDDFIRIVPGEKGAGADPEKIDFPANFGGVPTYEAAFGYDDDVPPPPGTRTLGPRFYMQENAALSIDTTQLSGPEPVNMTNFGPPPIYASPSSISSPASSLVHGSDVTMPSPAHSRSGSDWTMRSGLPTSVRPLVRKGSAGSQRSYASTRSASSSNESAMSKEMRPRWVIE